MESPRCVAVVLAAGSGTRLGQPKQFLSLVRHGGSELRLIDVAVGVVARFARTVVVVVPEGSTPEHCHAVSTQLHERQRVDASLVVVPGGSHRLASLANGLSAATKVAPGHTTVIVHDAAHPLAAPDLVGRLRDAIDAGASVAVPFLEAVDVIKQRGDSGVLTTMGRANLGAAQVPMAFSALAAAAVAEQGQLVSVQRQAHEESHVAELTGITVSAVDGDVANIHVVDHRSLAVARAIATVVIDSFGLTLSEP